MKSTPANTPSMPDLSRLSADELRAIVSGYQQQLVEKDAALQQHVTTIRQREHYIHHLEELLRLAKIQRFAASSEKLDHQIRLFDEAELEAEVDALREQLPDDTQAELNAAAESEIEAASPPARKQRQRGFCETLVRERIELTLSDEEKVGASKVFFTKVKEELKFIPAQLKVLEYWQEKAVFEHDDKDHIVAAARPAHPLGKCMASVSLLSYLIVSKYADGLPLYRMESLLARLGHHVSRTNMANWIIGLHDVLKPLITLMREVQNSSDYLQADETRIQVLKEDGKTAQSDKWMWVIRGGPPLQPSVLFEYDPSRASGVAARLLDGFSGVLQADGYSGYAPVCRDAGITRIGCWDHARRKFVEAVRAISAKAKKGPPSKADVALGHIQKLYAIERQIKTLSTAERYRIRQEKSLPLLIAFNAWLMENVSKVMLGSLTRKAMDYTLNQWPHLIGYCQRGDLHISNVLAENAIRPFAVGRKAWLFADTVQGARASATCYSLIETAKANGLEPSAYILHVLNSIAGADTLEKLEALLPWNVKLKQE